MPLKEKVAYSQPIKINGRETLGLFNNKNELIDIRVCVKDRSTGRFTCPSKKSEPRKRARIAKTLGIKP